MQGCPHVLLSVLLFCCPPAPLKALSLHCSQVLPASALHGAPLASSTLSLPRGVAQHSQPQGDTHSAAAGRLARPSVRRSLLYTLPTAEGCPSSTPWLAAGPVCQALPELPTRLALPPCPTIPSLFRGSAILARGMLGGCPGTLVACRGPSNSPLQHRNHSGSLPAAALAPCSLAQGGCGYRVIHARHTGSLQESISQTSSPEQRWVHESSWQWARPDSVTWGCPAVMEGCDRHGRGLPPLPGIYHPRAANTNSVWGSSATVIIPQT